MQTHGARWAELLSTPLKDFVKGADAEMYEITSLAREARRNWFDSLPGKGAA